MTILLEEEAVRALDGDREALDSIVRALQDELYGLALRMLCHREDAEDATQEILVRVVTRLSQFDFHHKLRTWAYRVAANYLLDVKRSPVERLELTFDQFADDLAHGLASSAAPADAERSLAVEEVRISCALGMLQCLDRPHRLAYILGELREFTVAEAAEILRVTPHVFRKRFQHARSSLHAFTREHCGLASDSAACRCNLQVPAALRAGKIRSDGCVFAGGPMSFEQARGAVRQGDRARWASEVHRRSQPRGASLDFARQLVVTIDVHHDL